MPSLTIKNIPEDLYERIKRSAEAHRRSMNSEIISSLEQALLCKAVEPDAFLEKVDSLRRRIALPPLTEEILRAAKSEGRP